MCEKGSRVIVKKCKAMMWNFEWLGGEHNNWVDYCAHKNVGGLRLMDLEKAFLTLMCKLMLMVMEPCESNLKTLLRFKLVNYKPS